MPNRMNWETLNKKKNPIIEFDRGDFAKFKKDQEEKKRAKKEIGWSKAKYPPSIFLVLCRNGAYKLSSNSNKGKELLIKFFNKPLNDDNGKGWESLFVNKYDFTGETKKKLEALAKKSGVAIVFRLSKAIKEE